VQLSELTPDELYQVLTGPPDSLAREYKDAVALDGATLDLREGALRSIVEYAVQKRLGARGLRSILEEVLADILFEAPERRSETLVVDRDYCEARLTRLDAAALRD
jgi:ATP-dependent Clp protease ATP-binding subunit ClpX